MVKKDGATASIEENAEVQAPTEEQSNVQSSTAESVETQAPNEEDAEMQALFEGLDGNEPEQSGAEETAPKGKPTRADVLREARRRRAERSESVRAYQEFLIGLSSLTVAAKNHSIVNGLVSHIEQRNDVDSEVPCVMIIALVSQDSIGFHPKKGSEGKNASGRRGHQYLPGRGMAGKAVRVEVTRRCPNHYGIPGQTLRDGAWKGGAGPWLILLVSTAQTALPDAISRRLVLHGRSFRRR